ncbi:RNA polymerase sigma factor [Paenibacillus lycopersici]|uniref:RNA polymerase sigma factor n=2 Tax=Paenibacillus lycopersici TaxID=2704462 RepID=A0A6C0G7W6_9BACL|nr:RNA polymerase sigma factor [Paenibacillus lycopersici]
MLEGKLLQLYNEMIAVARSNVYNKSDAQDAVQEAWVRMLANRGSLREADKLNAWAKVITANAARSINLRAKRIYPVDASEFADNAGTSRDEQAIMLEIRELLESVDPRTRALLLYKFYFGYKDQEIAEAWKLPVGTIKARIHRAKRRLQQWMSN